MCATRCPLPTQRAWQPAELPFPQAFLVVTASVTRLAKNPIRVSRIEAERKAKRSARRAIERNIIFRIFRLHIVHLRHHASLNQYRAIFEVEIAHCQPENFN